LPEKATVRLRSLSAAWAERYQFEALVDPRRHLSLKPRRDRQSAMLQAQAQQPRNIIVH